MQQSTLIWQGFQRNLLAFRAILLRPSRVFQILEICHLCREQRCPMSRSVCHYYHAHGGHIL